MRASVFAYNFLRFVEKEVIFFKASVFVIPMCKRPIDDSHGNKNIFIDALKLTVGANKDILSRIILHVESWFNFVASEGSKMESMLGM